MRKQRADSLLISLWKETNRDDHLRQLHKYNISVVYFDFEPPFEEANKVFCNMYKGTSEMISRLVYVEKVSASLVFHQCAVRRDLLHKTVALAQTIYPLLSDFINVK